MCENWLLNGFLYRSNESEKQDLFCCFRSEEEEKIEIIDGFCGKVMFFHRVRDEKREFEEKKSETRTEKKRRTRSNGGW